MKIGIIVGSHRKQSQSAKVAKVAREMLLELRPEIELFELDLGKNSLPMWDEGVWDGEPKWVQIWDPIAAQLRSCDGFIFVVPEYSGMVPAALRNFMLLTSSQELGHKPGLLVSVSNAFGGSYPIAELRATSYKNTRINWIPDHVIIRHCERILNDAIPNSDDDKFARSRMRYCLKILIAYSEALTIVRDSGIVDFKGHPYGM